MHPSFALERLAMVDGQIRPNRVTEPALIEAFKAIPKEMFTPEAYKNLAYVDENITMPCGEIMLKPITQGRMLQALQLQGNEFVLNIGCSTGYSAALLSKLCATVIGLTHDHDCAQKANKLINDLSLDNVIVVENTLCEGYAKQAPYDVIMIEGNTQHVPSALFNQLANHGRLLTLMENERSITEAVLFTKIENVLSKRVLFEAPASVLKGFEKTPHFEL